MRRILYFGRDYTPHDHRFLTALAASDLQVGYLRLEDAGRALEERPLPAGVEALAWAGGTAPARLGDGWKLLGSLRTVIRRWQPDIIQAGPLQSAGLLTALAGFPRLVSTSWGYDLLIDAGRNAAWRWATQFTLRRSAAFVGDCQTIRDLAVQHGMHPGRIVTFPWGADLERFYPAQAAGLRQRLGWGADLAVVLSTRGWAPLYGIEELARGFSRAAQQRPELRLLMLGAGAQAALVRQIFSEAGVLERVHFAGHIRQADLPDYYRAADLYLSASHSDGSSISLLEALACGKPALVSDIPGNREWVTPGAHGWWFRTGDPQALSQALLQALDARSGWEAIGGQCRALAEQRADWKKNFPHLLEAYDLAMDGR